MNKDKKEVKANIWKYFKMSMKEGKYTEGANAINNDNIRILTLQLLKMIAWCCSSPHFAPAFSTPMWTHLSVSGGLSHWTLLTVLCHFRLIQVRSDECQQWKVFWIDNQLQIYIYHRYILKLLLHWIQRVSVRLWRVNFFLSWWILWMRWWFLQTAQTIL